MVLCPLWLLMAYQVLARKWRPQDFDRVVGQEPVVQALQNALSDGRIAQAYLFSGIRGVGKTSVARILAKALNCERGPAKNPCNECGVCLDITAGRDLDVIEHDAATYSKVEQVRELNESLKYGPARDRYKIVILDEIHRLSRQAFDALLKIVEEPPAHLVFIFATTEADAVPATVLSRCQEYRFRRVSLDELSSHLEGLAKSEGIKVGRSALRIVARAGDGSVRDAVALLDQLATFGSGSIEDEDAARLLGGLDHSVFRDVLAAILAGDRKTLTAAVSRVETDGWDPRFVYTEFLAYCRMALRVALGAEPFELETTDEEAKALAELVQGSGYENLLRTTHLLLQSEESLRRSESAALALEIAWLRAAELPKLVDIEEFLSGAAPTGSKTTSPETQKTPAPPKPPKPATPANAPKPENKPKEPDAESSSLPSSAPPADDVAGFLALVSRDRQALAAHLAGAQSLAFEDDVLRISVAPGDRWLRERLARSSNRSILEGALKATWGSNSKWRLVEEGPPQPATELVPEAALAAALKDPRVQAVLDIFGGSVEAVESTNPDSPKS